jgi:hypothetical protein
MVWPQICTIMTIPGMRLPEPDRSGDHPVSGRLSEVFDHRNAEASEYV